MGLQVKSKRPKNIPERIRHIRGYRSQTAFAELLNSLRIKCIPKSRITQPMISRYEQGVEIPKPFILLRIAKAGDTTVEWILTGRNGG